VKSPKLQSNTKSSERQTRETTRTSPRLNKLLSKQWLCTQVRTWAACQRAFNDQR